MIDDGETHERWMAQVWTNWSIAAALALAFCATGWLAAQEPAESDLVAASGSVEDSAALAGYLIQGTNSYALEALAKKQGWQVTRRLRSINAIAVLAPVSRVTTVANRWPGVIRVTANHSVRTSELGVFEK